MSKFTSITPCHEIGSAAVRRCSRKHGHLVKVNGDLGNLYETLPSADSWMSLLVVDRRSVRDRSDDWSGQRFVHVMHSRYLAPIPFS